MLRNSRTHIPAQMKSDISKRMKTFCPKHSIRKCVNLSRRFRFQSSLLVRGQAEPQLNAQLVE